MEADFNWGSISQKFGSSMKGEGSKKIILDANIIADKFIEIMNKAIDDSNLTDAEKQRVKEVTFARVGTTANFKTKQLSVGEEIVLGFSFWGNKIMEAITINGDVIDLIALFNNGYASNNVDIRKPPRGSWHGKPFTVWPRSKPGAHFIGKAINEFKRWAAANGLIVEVTVDNPFYNDGAS